MKPRVLFGAAAVAAVFFLASCSAPSPTPDEGDAPSTSDSADQGGGGTEEGAATGEDACGLVSSAQLAAAVGVDPVDGVAADGEQGLKQCTWTFSDTHVVIAQYTSDADNFLPDGVWPQSENAQEIPGATRGFSDASVGTLLVVKGSDGVIVNDIDPGGSSADQAQWTALGESILAKL